MATTTTGAGLEGVVATQSQICYIDGELGILSYQGFDVHTLAENATFEEVIYLLWHGRLPKRAELEELKLGGDRISGINFNFLKLLPKPKKLSFNGIQRRNGGACWTTAKQ